MTHIEFPGDVDSPDAGIRVSRRIADELRRTRVAHGLSIEDVATILRIRAGFIEAMEEDRFDDLPGPAYISGFLRTYANHLGLDGEQLVAWFKDDSHSTFAPREMELLVPISEIRRPTFPIITVSLVIAVGIAVAWYVFQERQSIDIDLIPEVPGPVAEGTSTDLPDDEGAVVLDGDDVIDTVADAAPGAATDTMPGTVEPDDETEQVAGADVPPDTAGMTGDDGAADDSGLAEDDIPDDTASDAEEDSLLVIAGLTGDDDAADVAPDVEDVTVGGSPDDGTAGTDADLPDDDTADVAADSVAMAVDDSPDDAAAGVEAVIPQDAVDDGAADAVPDSADDAVTGVEVDTQQDEAGVVLEDAADAAGGEESWDEPVFASEDTFEESAAVDEGEEDSQHTVYGTPGAGSRIELRAIDETWVQVTAPDGVAVLTHILLPGDVYHVPDRDDLMLDTGNAGGLEIRVDGELLPPLGGAGAVVRDVLLSVESLTRR